MYRCLSLSCLIATVAAISCSSDAGTLCAGAGNSGANGVSASGAANAGATSPGGAAGRMTAEGGTAGGGAAGESGDGGAGDPAIADAGASGASDGTWQLRALTFNAALAPGFEPRSAERLPEVLSALQAAAKELDVLCVQEFWEDSDFAQLLGVTAESFHDALHPSPLPGSGECAALELGSIGDCVRAHCGSADPEDLVGCIQNECPSEVRTLSGGCLGCLINHLDDFGQCAPAGERVVSDPAIFGGDYDTGLLSRYPMSKKEVLPLSAYFQRGAVLYAQIEVPRLGAVHAFCTHLSSSLGVIPYAGPFGSWEGEHTRETEQLLNFVQAKAGDSGPVLLMGDLNMGLSLNGGQAVLADDFELLLATGLKDPYLDGGQAQCSECNDNTFRSADSTNDLIDHLLLKHFPSASARVTRAFTSPVALDLLGAGGRTQSHLSDHYGLRLDLEAR